MDVIEASTDNTQDLFEMLTGAARTLALWIRAGRQDEGVELVLAEDGSIDWRSPANRGKSFGPSRLRAPPAVFVTAESLHPREMAGTWDQVLVQGREQEVIESMRILQDDLASIHFLTGDVAKRTGSPAGIVLGLEAGAPRVPMGSYGDGMRRLLALSLSLLRAADGFLLVDEIDTGLHWTAMEDLWKLVVETAVRSSIQVFATTHSLDCILGLAKLIKARPDLRDGVSIQKIERQLAHSVNFDAAGILAAADLGIELR